MMKSKSQSQKILGLANILGIALVTPLMSFAIEPSAKSVQKYDTSIEREGLVPKSELRKTNIDATETAAKSGKKMVKVSPQMQKQMEGRLSTQFSFSGSKVGGQYQIPAEATAKIENEKPLEELLGLRAEFNDRKEIEKERF